MPGEVCPHDNVKEYCKRLCLSCGHACLLHEKVGWCEGDNDKCECREFEDDPGR
jgi:hypothetical protein